MGNGRDGLTAHMLCSLERPAGVLLRSAWRSHISTADCLPGFFCMHASGVDKIVTSNPC